MKRVCVSFPMGCNRSLMDAAVIFEYFKANGWQMTNLFDQADIILVGTCGLNSDSERMSTNYLSMVKSRAKKDAILVAFGCLAGINPERLIKEFDIIPLARKEQDKLDSIIGATRKIETIKDPNDLNSYIKYMKSSFTRYDWFRAKCDSVSFHSLEGVAASSFRLLDKVHTTVAKHSNLYDIRISSGCTGNCSYCAIRFEAGSLRSKPMDDVLAEFRKGLAGGHRHFRLVAEDVGSYGIESGSNIVELLEEIFRHKEEFQLMFDDFSPKWLVKWHSPLVELFAGNSKRLGPISLPIQSGSERILQLMKRGYTAQNAQKAITALIHACPSLYVKTHLIIGFPGETETDFLDSMHFVKSVPFKLTLIFKYSDRPCAPASKLPGQVSERTKDKRVWALMLGMKPGTAIPAV